MTLVTTTLETEAACEAARIAAARKLATAGDQHAAWQLEGDRPWVTIARGWKLRARLRHRVVFLWRIALEDASGAIVESHLLAVVGRIDRSRTARRKRSLTDIVRALESSIPVELAKAMTSWERTAEQSIQSFSSAQTDRRRAVAAQPATARQGDVQPGLFDRRAERAWSESAEHAADASADANDSVGASLARATLSRRPPQLLLVLVP